MPRLRRWSLLLALVFPAIAVGNVGDWQTFFSLHSVYGLVRIEADLWGATSGGLFRLDLNSLSFETFTNSEGLSSNDVRALVPDDRGNLILGLGNAFVDVFNLATHQVTQIPDFWLSGEVYRIYALYHHEGEIFVGTDLGVSRLVFFESQNRYLVQGNYTQLGLDFPAEIPGQAITVFDDGLWVGTTAGIARGDLSQPYLEAPESWTNFTTAQGLGHNNITALMVHDNKIFAASFNLGMNYQNSDSTFALMQVSPFSDSVYCLRSYQGTFYMARPGGVYHIVNGQYALVGTPQSVGRAMEFEADGTIWAGTMSQPLVAGGLARLEDDQWVSYCPEGIRGEVIKELLVEPNGALWVGGAQMLPDYADNATSLLGYYHSGHWINFTRQNDYLIDTLNYFHHDIRALTRDATGSIWVGSHGAGVAWLRAEADTIFAEAYYNASNSDRLFGIAADPDYCVVRDLLTDNEGNVWICNSEANVAAGPPIAVVPASFIENPDPDSQWVYLTIINQYGSPLGNAEFMVDRILMDSFGRKWFGSNNNVSKRLWVLEDHGTLEAEGDEWTEITQLAGKGITALACDHEGLVWVGTTDGLFYFYPQENVQYLYAEELFVPLGQNIMAVGVDPQNNKWIGTNAGVAVLGADNYTWLNLYTDALDAFPSPLPNNQVQSIAFDPVAGYVYLGTGQGLTRLGSPYKAMGTTVRSVNAWPNPFLIGEGLTDRLYLDSGALAQDSKLKIFTASGLLVTELNTTELNSGWDGRNSRRELVATGIYFLLAYSADGSAQVGKVAVIR